MAKPKAILASTNGKALMASKSAVAPVGAKYVPSKGAEAMAGKKAPPVDVDMVEAEADYVKPEDAKVAMVGAEAAAFAEMAGGAEQEAGSAPDAEASAAAAEATGGEGMSSTPLVIGGVLLGGAAIAAAAGGGGGKSKNAAPTVSASTQSVTTREDTSATITVSASDADGDTLSYSAGAAANGTVTGGANGAFVYTPKANFNGSDSFVVTVSDGKGGTVTQTVNVTVSAVNDAPTIDAAATRTITTDEDMQAAFVVKASDVDTPESQLVPSIATAPANGTIVRDAQGNFFYRPDENFNGTDSFLVSVSDGQASTSYTVNVTVNPVNDAPTIDATATRTITTDEDTQAAFVIEASDIDTPESQLVASISTQPANGAIVTDAQGNPFYRPNANFHGNDSFVVSVSDGQASTSYTVNVTVNPINDAPVFAQAVASFTSDEDQPLTFDPGATDVDGDALTYAAGPVANGTVTVGSDGRITFTPSQDFYGQTSFVLTASDGNGGVASQTVTVTVLNQPDVVNLDQLDQIAQGGDADISTVRTFDASTTDFRFDDSSAQSSNTRITGFGDDDFIQVEAPIENYNFSSNGTDIFVSYQTDSGAINLFELIGVVTNNSVLVFDEISAEQAAGFDFFRTTAAPQEARTVNIDVDTDNNLNTIANFSGAGFATTFTQNANVPDFVQIGNFGADDRILISNAEATDFNFSSNGSDIFISYQTAGGVSNDMTLLGVVHNPSVLVVDEASAELAVGYDFFQQAAVTPPPPAPVQNFNLDTDTDNNLNTQAPFSGAGIAGIFAEDANTPNFVRITDFGSDDRIVVTHAAAGDFNFSSNGSDIFISYQTPNGTVNDISLIGAVQNNNVLVFDEITAEQAVGADFFQFG